MAPIGSSFVVLPPRELSAAAGPGAERAVVWVRGEHDLATVTGLWETIARAIELSDADLVVDLSGVQFIDASTIRVIIRARDRLRLQSRSLALRSPSTCARRLVDLCGLADLLDPPEVDATPETGSAGALGTWVAVPVGNRDLFSVVGVIAPRAVSSVKVHHPAVAPASVAGCGGP